MLGILDAWSTSHLSQWTTEPAYCILDCRISSEGYLFFILLQAIFKNCSLIANDSWFWIDALMTGTSRELLVMSSSWNFPSRPEDVTEIRKQKSYFRFSSWKEKVTSRESFSSSYGSASSVLGTYKSQSLFLELWFTFYRTGFRKLNIAI